MSPATISSARATPRIGVQRSRRSTRRGSPPPASAPTTSASATTLRNRSIVRGEQRPRRWSLLVRHGGGLLRLLGWRWPSVVPHAGQLVRAIGLAVEGLAVQADQDRHDLRVELDP